MSKRHDKKDLKEFLNLSKLSIDDALNTENPIYEVARRLNQLPRSRLSRNQLEFEGIFYFFGDALSGGFVSALGNDSGKYFHETEAFAVTFCSSKMVAVLEAVKSMFPDSHIPKDRNLREEIIETLTDRYEKDPFDDATSDFFDLESEFHDGLLDYLKKHRDEFANMIEA